MKIRDVRKDMLVSLRETPDIVWGKVIFIEDDGHLLVESFAQNTRHFINAGKFIEFPVVIEADNGGYYASVPKFKGLHTYGETVEEANKNAEDAVRAYLKSMLKHNEVKFNGNTRRYERMEA